MSKPGLSIESASSVIARDMIQKHMHAFAHVIRCDRVAGQSTAAAFIAGLAGTLALVIAGGHGQSRDEVLDAACKTLREAVNCDLQHLAGL